MAKSSKKRAKSSRKFAPKKPPGAWRRRVLWCAKWAATFGVWGIIIGGLTLGWYATDLPDIDSALEPTRKPGITVLDRDGGTLAQVGELYGMPVSLDALPSALPQAVLATEDRRFHSHFGLDPIGLARAAWVNVRAGRIRQGGSTLTQQVAKNLFLTPERTIKRKIQEVMLALWLEHRFTKDQILTIYLNRVYLGAGTYGVDAAARKYFGKPARRLNLWQSAMLAGLLKAPSRYNPHRDPEAAAKRTRQVLANMVAAGYLTHAGAKTARASGARAQGARPGRRAPYFVDWVLDQVAGYVGPTDRDLVVKTTLDPRLQKAAENHVRAVLRGPGAKANAKQSAVLAMTPSGAVRVMVGGRDYGHSQFNRAVQALRQPGSAFKPVVYLAGLEAGLTPDSIVDDAPIAVGGWQPSNYDGRFRGKVTLEQALAASLNTVAVRVAQKAGPKRIARVAGELGIDGNDMPRDLGIALGTHETTLIALTAAYASFANNGRAVLPHGIRAITDTAGNVLYSRRGDGPGRIVQSQRVTAMNRMLAQAVATGTGKRADIGRPQAGKTGTSQDHRDAWFIGYTADMIAGVWLGNDNGTPMKRVTGGGLPAMLWRQLMADAHRGLPVRGLPGVGVDSPPMPDATSGLLTKLVSVLGTDGAEDRPDP